MDDMFNVLTLMLIMTGKLQNPSNWESAEEIEKAIRNCRLVDLALRRKYEILTGEKYTETI